MGRGHALHVEGNVHTCEQEGGVTTPFPSLFACTPTLPCVPPSPPFACTCAHHVHAPPPIHVCMPPAPPHLDVCAPWRALHMHPTLAVHHPTPPHSYCPFHMWAGQQGRACGSCRVFAHAQGDACGVHLSACGAVHMALTSWHTGGCAQGQSPKRKGFSFGVAETNSLFRHFGNPYWAFSS